MTRVSAPAEVIVVHYGPPEATARAVAAALATGWAVTVVDNAGTLELGDDATRLRVLRPRANVGFGRAVNLAARDATARWLLLLNPDTRAEPEALKRLVNVAEAEDDCLAVLSPALVYFDGSPQITGGQFAGWVREAARITGTGWRLRGVRGSLRSEFRANGAGGRATVERPWVSGAAMLIRRAAFEAVGGMDERFFLYYEDEDLCRRLRAGGWRVAVAPDLQLGHAVQGTSASLPEAYEESRALYHRIHSGPLLRRVVAWDSARRLRSLRR